MPGITVVSTALNASKYVARCLHSVRYQTVRARHIYIDAASDDDTAVTAATIAHNDRGSSREGLIEVVAHVERLPLLENLVPVIRALPHDEIVVWLDGDDWLAHRHALARVLGAYEAIGAWMTYGQFQFVDGTVGFASQYAGTVVDEGIYRRDVWRGTHLKTFRAGLFQHVPKHMLTDNAGAWFELAVDQAVMFPMLEMSRERAIFIPEVLYTYNREHSFEANASPQRLMDEREAALLVRAKAPLARLA